MSRIPTMPCILKEAFMMPFMKLGIKLFNVQKTSCFTLFKRFLFIVNISSFSVTLSNYETCSFSLEQLDRLITFKLLKFCKFGKFRAYSNGENSSISFHNMQEYTPGQHTKKTVQELICEQWKVNRPVTFYKKKAKNFCFLSQKQKIGASSTKNLNFYICSQR